ncbi:MAG: RHS repeat-associated core domain-containing protein, partial [Myxococcota bacterium]
YPSSSPQCDETPPEGVRSFTARYDGLRRTIATTMPDADMYGEPSATRIQYEPLTTLSYDPNDTNPSSPHADTPRITRTDGLGRTTHIERMLAADGLSATVELQYDGLGRLTHVTDPGGNTKEQFYDLLGRVTRVIDPNSAGEMTMEYDDASNLIRKTDDRGITIVTEFDGVNRAIAIYDEANPTETRIETQFDVASSCDPSVCTHTANRVASVAYPGLDGERAEERFGYDNRGRSSVYVHHLKGVAFEFRMAYDNAGRLTATTYPGGRTIERSFDGLNRLTSLDGLLTIGYDGRGLLSEIAHTDGTTMAMTYDSLMRPAQLGVTDRSGTELQGWSYTRDRAGNITSIAANAEEQERHFTYDAWYRVLEASFGKGAQMETISYGFDLLDNIISRISNLEDSTADLGPFHYDTYAPNALSEAGGAIFEYDAAGNMIGRDRQTLEWDFMGRLTRVTSPDAPEAQLIYGANQRRIAKRDDDGEVLYPSQTFEVRDGISTLYLKVGRHRVVRLEDDTLATTVMGDPQGDGEVNAADAWAARSDGADAFLRTSVRRLLMEVGPEEGVTFLHHDHLGNLTMATGQLGGEPMVLGQRAFDMLGAERADGWGYVDEYGFTGQELDRSTGLIHFDWRYLDPKTGRWLSIDPLFEVSTPGGVASLGESTTGYVYVAGRFANAVDPTGLNLEELISQLDTLLQEVNSDDIHNADQSQR